MRGADEARVERARNLHSRARDIAYAYDFAKARAHLLKALGLLDDVVDQESAGSMPVLIHVLVTLAYVETEGGQVTTGLSRLDAASRLADAQPEPKRSELLGLALEQRGILLIRAGELDEALEVLDEAEHLLAAALSAGAGDPTVLATLYLNRSLAHIEAANPSAAVAELRRCVDFAAANSAVHGSLGIKARHNLGYVAYMTGDIPTALRYYEEARDAGLQPTLLLDRARALLAAGLAEEAARNLADALPMLRKQRAGQDAAEVEVTLAAAELLQGNAERARQWARRAERRFTRRGNARWAAVAALAAMRAQTDEALARGRSSAAHSVAAIKLADRLRSLMLEDEAALALMLAIRLELLRGDVTSAEILIDQMPAGRPTTPVDNQMMARLCRAELAVARGERRRALAEARAGLTVLGKARDRMGGLELVCGTAIHGRKLGELAIQLVLDGRRTDPRRLFTWLEQTRAQVYRYEPLPTIADSEMATKAAELRHVRRALQLDRLAGRPVGKLDKLAAALQRDVVRLGWHTSAWGSPRPVASLDEVSVALGDRALVEFAMSRGHVVAVVVAAGRTRLIRLGAAADAAEPAARLHADLDALAPDTLPAAIVDVVRGSAERSAEALDRQLIRPLMAAVGDRELVIVPTGSLYAVPWGVVPSLQGRPVVVAPSATAWLAAHRAVAPPGRTLLARGPLLTGDVVEDAMLRSVYSGAVVLEEEQATVAGVLAALDGAELAHLAAHGEHEPTNALFSRLELADGPLFAYEVAQLRQPPRQVVLAACELALNYVRPGDEALGYAGALLAGGVQTVVAATSRVGDAAAAGAMVEYHQRLSSGVAPARALAESIAEDPYRRPFICLGAG
ncbi:CHAT domain-containing protein [Actinokineospora xionganensis]|uniref:CHAT domain-containing protein n=1 Tax=Actinokineospora xionganensis TaxID=2684470 RepID=A0ABR7L8E1_9PSEU|nr:CHAT domain-containing protein [Actinokineospora xionganensis]MBC6448914.1 CHAT domain-containing protein [Actinokineospora xionganensis]